MTGQTSRSLAYWDGGGEHAEHFVYRCYDADGVLLYVGCTMDVKKRIASHRRGGNGTSKASRWLSLFMTRYEVEGPFRGRDAGRAAEHAAIQADWPIFNYQGQTRADRAAWMTRGDVARYLTSHGEIELALETTCSCWREVRELNAYMESCFAHVAAQVAGITNLRSDDTFTMADWEAAS